MQLRRSVSTAGGVPQRIQYRSSTRNSQESRSRPKTPMTCKVSPTSGAPIARMTLDETDDVPWADPPEVSGAVRANLPQE